MFERKKTTEKRREPQAARHMSAQATAKAGARTLPKKRKPSFFDTLFSAMDKLFSAIDKLLRARKFARKPAVSASAKLSAAAQAVLDAQAQQAAAGQPLFRQLGSPVIPEFICPNTPLSGFSLIKSSPVFTKVLIVSAVIHVLVITMVTFSTVIRAHHDTRQTLQVALVNSKTASKPSDARLLAQHNLDGGGNTDEDLLASTPLPYTEREREVQKLEAEVKKQKQEVEDKVRLVMMGLNQNAAKLTAEKSQVKSNDKQPNAQEQMDNFLKMVQLQAQIQKEFNEWQKRPKKTFIGARAEEYRFAAYVEDWRLTIEEIGKNNYPEAARRLKLTGALRMTVGLMKDGTVESAVIETSSGNRILDAAALKIVDLGAPYRPFPEEIKEDTDILYITRTWTFTPGAQLETR